MASEVAQAAPAPDQQHEDAMDAVSESTPYPGSQVNGLGGTDEAAANASGFSGNAALPATDLSVNAKAQLDVNPAGPTPVEDVAPGIQPIADFVPKDASTLSHPTPPPDEPLDTGAADVDTEMANADSDATPPAPTEAAVPLQPEQSLVRPREEDDGDQPSAKRARVDDVPSPQAEIAPVSADSTEPINGVNGALGGVEQSMVNAEASAMAPVEKSESDAQVESMADVAPEASAARAPSETEATLLEPAESSLQEVKAESTPNEAQAPAVDAQPMETASTESALLPDQASIKFEDARAAEHVQAPPSETRTKASTAPLTHFQKTTLLDKMKNLKKTKHSTLFLKPVDHVALNIPTYPDIIKQPMDLGTMERKLKDNEYGSVQEFVDDFNLIISNVRRFNGDQHNVTQAGFNMRAYFDRMMETVPSADEKAPLPKSQKKRSPSLPQEPKRREARALPPPAPVPQAQSPAQQPSFALQSDGTPQIRRASSNVRPARAIKPPQNREIPYAKPKRKEHLLELKFCEHILEQIRSPKYGQYNHVFQVPVDPVALNIPNYHHVIKQPMDLSTMAQKMKSGQYGTATEFKKDFELMIKNCTTFNPIGNPVRDIAVAFQREFENLWTEKNKWEKKNAPASTRASSASAEGDSDEEEEEEEGAEPDDSTVAALKKQIAAMQSTLETLAGGAATTKASTKSAKSHKKAPSKKVGGAPIPVSSKVAPKTSKPKRERMITYEEKDEISKAVERMDEKQIGKLTEIITRECPKYRDMEEMELEIDDLPNNVQLMLLKYVRDIFGNPNRKKAAARDYSPDDVAAQDDDDFEPKSRGAGAGGRGGKRKKHAPMSKLQQEEQLRALQGKLQEFSNAATSGSESPAASSYNQQNAQVESSGDEESEESEEE